MLKYIHYKKGIADQCGVTLGVRDKMYGFKLAEEPSKTKTPRPLEKARLKKKQLSSDRHPDKRLKLTYSMLE